ncbi:MAG: TIGR03936 family radical SAM-associated protein [Phycisphaerales bacterium]|nr:TIGR03936 family radical SAM-associated protein [Phycisphaerales bacterium]
MRNRLAIQFAIEGDLRFISHHDSLRLFQRALVRSGLPIRYSEGFNPRPKMRISLPRPVGVASLAELLVLELVSDEDPAGVLSRLSAQIPEGMRLLSAEKLADRDRRLPSEVQYDLELEPQIHESVAKATLLFLSKKSFFFERILGKSAAARPIDIRPFVLDMTVTEDVLCWTQIVTPEGTARVNEVLESVGLSSRDYLHRVVRRKAAYRP